MVVLGASVPHQLLVAVTALPRFSRLLPVEAAVFPARRLKLMVTAPAPIAPVAIPPPLPVDVLPVMVSLESVAERTLAGLINNPAPFCAPAPFCPFWLLVMIVPWSIS